MIGQISARTSFEPAQNLLRTSFELASVMEFGFYVKQHYFTISLLAKCRHYDLWRAWFKSVN